MSREGDERRRGGVNLVGHPSRGSIGFFVRVFREGVGVGVGEGEDEGEGEGEGEGRSRGCRPR